MRHLCVERLECLSPKRLQTVLGSFMLSQVKKGLFQKLPFQETGNTNNEGCTHISTTSRQFRLDLSEVNRHSLSILNILKCLPTIWRCLGTSGLGQVLRLGKLRSLLGCMAKGAEKWPKRLIIFLLAQFHTQDGWQWFIAYLLIGDWTGSFLPNPKIC